MRLIDVDKIINYYTKYTAYDIEGEIIAKPTSIILPVSLLDEIPTATFEYDRDTKLLLEDLKQCNSCIRISDLVRKLETIDKNNNHGIWTIKQILQFIIINDKIFL